MQSAAWVRRRQIAIGAANRECAICCSAEGLHVYHRTYARAGNEDPSDLVVLCGDCHGLFHQTAGAERLRATAIIVITEEGTDGHLIVNQTATVTRMTSGNRVELIEGCLGALLATAVAREPRITDG